MKNPPTMQEVQVPPLGQEDPLEEEMATHSNKLAWKIPRTVEARVPFHGSGAMTRSPSPLAWRPDFPGAPREAH